MQNKQEAPLVTVCVSYYNDEKYLKTCIDSILNQSFKNFELILFNHASKDGSKEIAHSYNDDRIIHIDAPKNLGAGASYNFRYIMPYIKGEYYKPFCADDVMAEDCIDTLLKFVSDNPDKDIVFGNMAYIDGAGRDLKRNFFKEHRTLRNPTETGILKTFSTFGNRLPCPAVLMKTDVLKNVIMDNSLTICADMWLWLGALINGAKIGLYDEIVAYYRRHTYQESFLESEIMARRIEYEKFSFLSLFFSMKNIDLVKEIFDDSPYKDKLTDADDITFYIAEYFLRKEGYSFAYDKLFSMLQDEKISKHLEETFGFGVLELRKLYAFKSTEKNFKKRIYSKRGKYLTVPELAFLLLYRIIQKIGKIVTFDF